MRSRRIFIGHFLNCRRWRLSEREEDFDLIEFQKVKKMLHVVTFKLTEFIQVKNH